MAHYLPPAIMRFFQPRPPIEPKKPIVPRKMPALMGVSTFVHRFKDELPEPVVNETPQERKAKRRKVAGVRYDERIKRQTAKWNPKEREGDNLTGDAYKTLFVARLNFAVTEEDLTMEFEYYGPIVKVCIVKDKQGKSRGYGYVEFESSRDLKEAYKDADGRKIQGRRILVDVERGRTVKNWVPRRLGGGLGGTRIGGKDVNQKYSGREPPRSEGGTAAASSKDRERRSSRERDRDRDRSRRESGRDAKSSRSERSRERDGKSRDEDRGERERRKR